MFYHGTEITTLEHTVLIDDLKAIVGPGGWTTDANDLEPHLNEWRRKIRGRTPVLLSPATTGEVSAIVRACNAAGVAIVPQGGNTGMCAAAVPDESGEQILLNLARMNRIREIDAGNYSMVVEAGCILANIQQAAHDAGRHFPLSLGAEGSCQIGGNIATNAGGLNVVRYGNTRGLVLGLEVVLADGTVLEGLRALRKDTAGYDLKQLFIGSEGTLGIVTAATLKLFPQPGETSTAILAIDSAAQATEILGLLQRTYQDRIEKFELVPAVCFELVEKHLGYQTPFGGAYPWYLMLEIDTGGATDVMEERLMALLEDGHAVDAIVAKSEAEAEKLWLLRHSIAEAERHAGPALKHDVSVPLSRMADFVETAPERIRAIAPNATIVAFGHVGDGNLHYNVVLPPDELERLGEECTTAIYDLVAEFGGSFSAEHGVGRLKKEYLPRYRSEAELQLMRTLKNALDPGNILNPGKVL